MILRTVRETFQCLYYDALSLWIMLGSKIKQLCSSAIYKQTVSILLRLSDSVQCERGNYFQHVSVCVCVGGGLWVCRCGLVDGCVTI